jgi:hypothetical protein
VASFLHSHNSGIESLGPIPAYRVEGEGNGTHNKLDSEREDPEKPERFRCQMNRQLTGSGMVKWAVFFNRRNLKREEGRSI